MKRSRLMLVFLMVVIIGLPTTGLARRVKLNNDVAWVLVADTYKGCVQQAYANAMNRLRDLAEGEVPGTWCVIVDMDETIVSNVEFQCELQAAGTSYSRTAWDAWCRREACTLLPGAKEFCSLARELGGKVIVITNRQGHLRDVTLQNLDALGFPYDVCLLREGPYADDRSKQMRRSDVEKGTIKTLPPGVKLSPLAILMRAGDQEHDLFDESLSFEAVKDRFARDLIMIPNPMYGHWLPYSGVFFDTGESAAKPETAKESSPAITWQEAMQRVGQDVVVEGTIVNVYSATGRPAKLNFDRNWRESLSLVIFSKDQGKFGDLKTGYLNKKVRVSGKVSTYRDAVQIILSGPSQIEVVE